MAGSDHHLFGTESSILIWCDGLTLRKFPLEIFDLLPILFKQSIGVNDFPLLGIKL